jgi:hypothetical protein
MGVTTGYHGQDKLMILRLHRLLAFQEVWDKYLKGDSEISAIQVKDRAKKMLEVGLPFRLK